MSRRIRGTRYGVRHRARTAYLVPCTLALLSATGCSSALDAVAGVFGPGEVGGTVDAHVVYRLRPGCPSLLARTLDNGYTVMAPLGAPSIDGLPASAGADVEETGVFEGPVRTGEVVFRYVPPAASETWGAGPVDVVAEVEAVRLTLAEGQARLVERCGPPPATTAPVDIPRIPGTELPDES